MSSGTSVVRASSRRGVAFDAVHLKRQGDRLTQRRFIRAEQDIAVRRPAGEQDLVGAWCKRRGREYLQFVGGVAEVVRVEGNVLVVTVAEGAARVINQPHGVTKADGERIEA